MNSHRFVNSINFNSITFKWPIVIHPLKVVGGGGENKGNDIKKIQIIINKYKRTAVTPPWSDASDAVNE